MARVKTREKVPYLLSKKLPKVGTIHIKSFNYDSALYLKLYQYLYGHILKDYTYRMNPISLAFESGEIVTTRVRTAIINLIFWKPYIDTKRTIPVTAMFDTNTISEASINKLRDDIIDTFRPYMTIEQLSKCIRHIVESLATFPENFCVIQGNTIDVRDIIDIANKNERFDELIHTSYPDNMSMTIIEKDIMDKTYEAKSIIESILDSNIRPFMKAGGNVNIGQMSQCLISIGPRSDIYGNISPVIVNTNFIRGLRNVSDYYLESFSCRKALIANKYSMSDSGYTSRQMDLLGIDATLVDVNDCGAGHTIAFTIPDAKTLDILRYKYYETGKNKKGVSIYKEIVPERDTALIGQTINIRTHILCALPEGQYCKACYGELAYFVLGYHTNLLAMHSLSEPIGQMVLSTKHLNKTRTKTVEWPNILYTYFRCETDAIYPKPEICNASFEIAFYAEDIEEYLNIFEGGADDDEDTAQNENMLLDYVTTFELVINGESICIDTGDNELYINTDFLLKLVKSTKIENEKIYVSLAGIEDDAPIFDLSIENIEISTYLKRIMRLIGIKSKIVPTTIEDIVRELTEVIIELGIPINFAHIESLIYNMVRDPNMIIHRPKRADDPYILVPACTAITYSRALATSLSFERISDQLKNVYTYMKFSPAFLDPFFA